MPRLRAALALAAALAAVALLSPLLVWASDAPAPEDTYGRLL